MNHQEELKKIGFPLHSESAEKMGELHFDKTSRVECTCIRCGFKNKFKPYRAKNNKLYCKGCKTELVSW